MTSDSASSRPPAEDGYELWLRYRPVQSAARFREYRAAISVCNVFGTSDTAAATRAEITRGLSELLYEPMVSSVGPHTPGALLVGTPDNSPLIAALNLRERLVPLGPEGYLIERTRADDAPVTVVAANSEVGALYGAFRLLGLMQCEQTLEGLSLASAPTIQRRVLDHWDNLSRTVERGYAGFSLWDWFTLPDYQAPRYRDYARANASIGINGTVLTNVNANALILTEPYLAKVAALADVFRPYGLRVYLTARFNAPMELDGLPTADPLDARVIAWWRAKARAIYRAIPDFGGFLIKANSEGQPGPRHFGRTHADGANLLADALAEYGGIVMWRAFVYDEGVPDDRAKQAYSEFVPLDGRFRDNVLVQVKNGPIDFQPREPFHPLFGAMPKTPLMVEFQLTQEYLGCSTHLAYLGTLFEECLNADTFALGAGSLVRKVVDGSLEGHALSGIAGVANIGSDRNWCGHPFAQSNWFAFGRLAWEPGRSAAAIAEEWVRRTFSNDARVVAPLTEMMLASREAVVDYMTPLGLNHLMAWDHHYGPGPWIAQGRRDWTSVYFHRADAEGLGFDRSAQGSNAVAQYAAPLAQRFGELASCPEELLLWFHHVRWDRRLRSGRTLWEELCFRYQRGVDAVRRLQTTWAGVEAFIDAERFAHVTALLGIQEREARWWRDACLLYFQTFAKQPLPSTVEPPGATLEDFERIVHRFVPGTPGH